MRINTNPLAWKNDVPDADRRLRAMVCREVIRRLEAAGRVVVTRLDPAPSVGPVIDAKDYERDAFRATLQDVLDSLDAPPTQEDASDDQDGPQKSPAQPAEDPSETDPAADRDAV